MLIHSRGAAVVIGLLLYVLAVHYCSYACQRDPTSAFFKHNRGYRPLQSSWREHQAEKFINNGQYHTRDHSTLPVMCIGITTIARPGRQYLPVTIGSLLDGLDLAQREALHLTIFVAHTSPEAHPLYQDKQLRNLADRLLMYNVADAKLAELQAFEENHLYRNKSVYDYGYILQDCYDTGAKWIAIIEDDTIAQKDWYSQALDALSTIEQSSSNSLNWVYLRMFYTEVFLGWNAEEWPIYLGWSLLMWLSISGGLLLIGKFFCRSLSGTAVVFLVCVYSPAWVGLYFVAGRLCMQPIPVGVHVMRQFGCCSQGLIFPREILPRLISMIQVEASVQDVHVDMAIEEWADKEDLDRWVVVPSLLQHVGDRSSKGDGYDDDAKKIWNFGFEMPRKDRHLASEA